MAIIELVQIPVQVKKIKPVIIEITGFFSKYPGPESNRHVREDTGV
jgi:hypothetical protein